MRGGAGEVGGEGWEGRPKLRLRRSIFAWRNSVSVGVCLSDRETPPPSEFVRRAKLRLRRNAVGDQRRGGGSVPPLLAVPALPALPACVLACQPSCLPACLARLPCLPACRACQLAVPANLPCLACLPCLPCLPCLSACLSPVCLPACLFAYLSICPLACQFVCLSAHLPVCLPARLPARSLVCLSVPPPAFL